MINSFDFQKMPAEPDKSIMGGLFEKWQKRKF
ncbi:hypothetical protein KKC_06527 [Listeria fleischmannii subsp. coloradonensis]|nr:hypothetical protein KKC_06527 [Listeria fleischmannii subsp. coloradonensis]